MKKEFWQRRWFVLWLCRRCPCGGRRRPCQLQAQPDLGASSVGINVGETKQLTATVTPAHTTLPTTWSSSNTAVATVSGTGVAAPAPPPLPPSAAALPPRPLSL